MEAQVKFYDISKAFRSDDRGWSVSPIPQDMLHETGKHLFHIVCSAPGAVRGNHCHLTTNEWIASWGGKTLFAWEEGGVREEKVFGAEEPFLVFIPKNTYHALKNLDARETYLFAFYDSPVRHYEKEIIRKPLLS